MKHIKTKRVNMVARLTEQMNVKSSAEFDADDLDFVDHLKEQLSKEKPS